MDQEFEKLTATELRKAMLVGGEFQQILDASLPPDVLAGLRAFQNSPAMKQIRAFQYSPGMKQIRAFQAGIKQLRVVREQTTWIGQIAQQIKLGPLTAIQPLELGLAIGNASELRQILENIGQSPLVDYFASGRAPDLSPLVEGEGHATLSLKATGDLRVVSAQELELERQIVEHFESGETASTLSRSQISYLRAFITFMKILILYLATQNGVREELCHFQPRLAPGLTANQTAKSIRAFMCQAQMPLEALRDYRIVKGEGVRLRSGPGRKSPVVRGGLDDRALLEVLDSSNPDWLHVSVVGEEGLEGWISRRYTKRLLD